MNVIVLIIAHHHLLSDFADLPGWGRRIVNEKSVPLRIYRRAIGCGAGETPELPFLISLNPVSRVDTDAVPGRDGQGCRGRVQGK